MKVKPEAPRMLIYSQDGFGLGHLRRNLNISLQIKKRCREASILIVADSPVAPFFKLPSKCDFIKLPTIVKIDTGVWRPNRLPMHHKDLLYIRSEIIQNVALSFKPHVFLVDHMPHGALGELEWPLRALRKYSPNTKIVLGLRDILGAPDVITAMWQREGAFEAAEKYYDAICIYGCDDVFHLVKEYQFPDGLIDKTRYCGYVTRDLSLFRRRRNNTLRQIREHEDENLVLVTGGGGADASYFMDKFLDAARLLDNRMRFKAVISTGPFMQKDQVQLLKKKAKGLPIWVKRNSRDSIDFLCSADLVVSMAGYNTISEIMRFRKNAIIVPRPGPSAEQTIRTAILSQRGLFNAIHPSQLTSENFAELIAAKLENKTEIRDEQLPELNGANNVSSFLLSTM